MASSVRAVSVLFVALLVTVWAPTTAGGSGQWGFTTDDALEDERVLETCGSDACLLMVKGGQAGQSEEIIQEGETFTWVADEVAQADVDFGGGDFVLEVGCQASTNETLEIAIGAVDNATGTFSTETFEIVNDPGNACSDHRFTVAFGVEGFQVARGDVLALQFDLSSIAGVNPLEGLTVFADETTLAPPESDPGYPVWEASSLVTILLGAVIVLGAVTVRG